MKIAVFTAMEWIRCSVLTILSIRFGERGISNVIPFPKADGEREEWLTPMERWLYDSLKQLGFQVHAKKALGPFVLDVCLPEKKIAIHCKEETAGALGKVRMAEKRRYLHKHGWKMMMVRPRCLYHDFQTHLRMLSRLPQQ
ncbi:MAG TPA: hypothetical protein VFK44_06230 [Bacillales bacterium]|nr:hypothetical protein [Bacillales bacterium]